MDIRQTLLSEHSKAVTHRVVQYVGADPDKMAGLMALFFAGEYRVTQRAAWAVGEIGAQSPALIAPYLETMIDHLNTPVHDAVKRNTVRIFRDLPVLPESLLGKLTTSCFNLLTDPKEPIAVKVFCIRILARVCEQEPGLWDELQLVLEDGLPHSSVAYRSAAMDVLKKRKI